MLYLYLQLSTDFVYYISGEDKFLQQLAIEEQFGVTLEEKEVQREKLNERKGTGAAIGYNYNDPGAQPSSSNGRFSYSKKTSLADLKALGIGKYK